MSACPCLAPQQTIVLGSRFSGEKKLPASWPNSAPVVIGGVNEDINVIV